MAERIGKTFLDSLMRKESLPFEATPQNIQRTRAMLYRNWQQRTRLTHTEYVTKMYVAYQKHVANQKHVTNTMNKHSCFLNIKWGLRNTGGFVIVGWGSNRKWWETISCKIFLNYIVTEVAVSKVALLGLRFHYSISPSWYILLVLSKCSLPNL